MERRYTLPNCDLRLEGFNPSEPLNPMAPMVTFSQVEFRFPGVTDPIIGGKELLEGLIEAVNSYVQGRLSGVPHRPAPGATPLVSLTPQGDLRHCLTLATPAGGGPPLEVTLTTVQLFDLVEAVDQFLADTQTLPEYTLKLTALPRRAAIAQVPLAQRILPAVAGTVSVVAAGLGLFFLPMPEVEPPDAQRPTSEAPSPDGATPTATPGPVDLAQAVASYSLLANRAPQESDPTVLSPLQGQLSRRLRAIFVPGSVREAVTYEVATSLGGVVLGFRPQAGDDTALLQGDENPLARLAVIPAAGSLPLEEPIALFAVTFLPNGTVQVLPLETEAP